MSTTETFRDNVASSSQECSAQSAEFELVDDAAAFFAPVSSDVIDGLLGQYQAYRARIARLAEVISQEADAVHYFIEGNVENRHRWVPSIPNMFDAKGAVAALNSSYWSKALALTDVYDCMPQARRDEWNKSIREQATPDFDEQTVRATLTELLMSRDRFFAERVDGIFRGLSGEHVTNAPEAFGKRMIMAYMWSGMGSFAYVNSSRAGLINDLRCVVAKFMGRDEPQHSASEPLLDALRTQTGVWHTIDGGAIRIRVYLKGTAHLEVHPEMAWRLNGVLASLHPAAIPAQFRRRPAKRQKQFVMLGRPLPFAVLALLPRPRGAGRGRVRDWRIDRSATTAALYDEAVRVIEAIGGTVTEHGWCKFDYEPDEVLQELALTGCIPDRVAHQFYPTPEKLARLAAELAEIGETDQVLEPSSGQGHLAAYLPKDRTTCVEVAPLHCAILRARGDCVHAIAEVLGAHMVPVKSACFFCPASKAWELWWLAAHHPELFERALLLERRALTGRHSRFDAVEFGASWEELVRGADRFPSTTTTVGLGRSFAWNQWARVNNVVDGAFRVRRETADRARFVACADALRGEDNAFDARSIAIKPVARVAAELVAEVAVEFVA